MTEYLVLSILLQFLYQLPWYAIFYIASMIYCTHSMLHYYLFTTCVLYGHSDNNTTNFETTCQLILFTVLIRVPALNQMSNPQTLNDKIAEFPWLLMNRNAASCCVPTELVLNVGRFGDFFNWRSYNLPSMDAVQVPSVPSALFYIYKKELYMAYRKRSCSVRCF